MRQGGRLGTKLLPLTLLSSKCVCFPGADWLCMFMRVFRQAATADPQAPAGPFSGRRAERSKAERPAEEASD